MASLLSGAFLCDTKYFWKQKTNFPSVRDSVSEEQPEVAEVRSEETRSLTWGHLQALGVQGKAEGSQLQIAGNMPGLRTNKCTSRHGVHSELRTNSSSKHICRPVVTTDPRASEILAKASWPLAGRGGEDS